MKFSKSRKIMITAIIFLGIIVASPIIYTNINNTKDEESSTENVNKKITFKFQESYIKIASYLEENGDLSKEELAKLEPDKKLVESDGYYYIGSLYNGDEYKDLRSIDINGEKEGVSVTYLYEDDKPKEALAVQYYNANENGYLNGIHSYYNKDSDESLLYITDIGTISAEDQEKLVNYIKVESKNKEEYKTYFRLAKIVQRSVSFPKEEFEKFDKKSISSISEEETVVKINDAQLVFMHDKKMEEIRGIKLIDKYGTLLYTKSFIGDSPHISGQDEIYTMTEIKSDSLQSQNDLLNKLSENVQESTPRTDGDDIINNNENHAVQIFSAEEDYDDMTFMGNISYSSEENPKELTMEESIEYVKSKLGENIEEVDRNYIDNVGVTVVTYELKDKTYKVRYQHPYKIDKDGNTLKEYNQNKSAGICIYEK